jgi:hypothetical protein
MKTAKVNLIEANTALNEDFIAETRNLSSNTLNDQINSQIHQPASMTDHHHHHHQPSFTTTATSSGANNNNTAQTNSSQQTPITGGTSSGGQSTISSNQQLYKLKQRLQSLRDSQQIVVVKIFPKYDMSIRLDLYSKRVREIKNIIYSRYGMCHTNCLPFAELVITDRAAFLFRQYVRYNLYDRLSTRPFLTLIEKKVDRLPAALRRQRNTLAADRTWRHES